MKQITILSTTAILGYGFPESSFKQGLAAQPQVIAVDAGSTDPGPAYLGNGTSFVDRGAVKRDLEYMIHAGLAHKIPVIIGTAGGSGSKKHVQWCLDIIEEILNAAGRSEKIAVIYSDISKAEVRKKLKQGRIKPLSFVPELTNEAIDQTTRIVAQIGVEPLCAALDTGAQIIVAGRCYDPAVFAAIAVHQGFDKGLALHLGKILECAAIAATPGSGRDCVLGILRENSFELHPLSDQRKFTVHSVAAHTLYEKSHPFLLPGPGGMSDLSETQFTQLTENSVEVRGSKYVPSPTYMIKLEGARLVGYRTICIAGIRDPILINQLDSFFNALRDAVTNNFGEKQYSLNFRVYGRDGVMGELEPLNKLFAHEVGIIIDVVAPTQQEADTICGFVRSTGLHYGYPGRIATAGNFAFPFSPSDIHMGPTYEFSIYHLMQIDDPLKLFPVETIMLGGAQ